MLKKVMFHISKVPLRDDMLDKAMSGLFVGIKRQSISITRIRSRGFKIPLFISRPVLAFQW